MVRRRRRKMGRDVKEKPAVDCSSLRKELPKNDEEGFQTGIQDGGGEIVEKEQCENRIEESTKKYASRFNEIIGEEKDGIWTFRTIKDRFLWHCPICVNQKFMEFLDKRILKAFALFHYERGHQEKLGEALEDECHNFDLHHIMELASSRMSIRNRCWNTLYTLDCRKFENGGQFMEGCVKSCDLFEKPADDIRFCLICLNFVDRRRLSAHFKKFHENLEAHSNNSCFFEVESERIENEPDGNDVQLIFPREVFAYCTSYKTVRRDFFKWRCCLCPYAHPFTFVTFVNMKMYSLRHIEEKHNFLFTEQFLKYEWSIIINEMKIGFDIRRYKPSDYTIKGNGTFNPSSINDFTLPQQIFLIPKEFQKNYRICGFCYRSMEVTGFERHCAAHGYLCRNTPGNLIFKMELTPKIQELMGRENFQRIEDFEEPEIILSIEGKRLKMKCERIAEKCRSSGISTPVKSEIDEDMTPKSRKSAIMAKKLLGDTFQYLQENAKNPKRTWGELSSSSSDSSENENDRDFVIKKRRTFGGGRKRLRKIEEREKSSAETLEWIRQQASAKGIEFRDSDTSDNEEVSMEVSEIPDDREMRCNTPEILKIETLDEMKPNEIEEYIKLHANYRGIEVSEDQDSENEEEFEKIDPKDAQGYDELRPRQIRKLLRKEARKRGIRCDFYNDNDSD